jgi:hypothetical protein
VFARDPLKTFLAMGQATGSKKGRSNDLNGKELGPENSRQLGAKFKGALPRWGVGHSFEFAVGRRMLR